MRRSREEGPGSLAAMATWRDGAAYAPIERPDGFASPVAPELGAVPPPAPITPGDVAPPISLTPPPHLPPLEAVSGEARSGRDPREAFFVASALLTEASATRDPRQPILTSTPRQPLPDDQLPPPAGAPLAPPMGDPFGASLSPPHRDHPAPGPPAAAPQDWPAPSPIQVGAPGPWQPGPNPPSGNMAQWPQHPAPSPPTLTTPQRTIGGVAIFLFGAAILFPAAAAFLMTAAGGLMLRLPGRLGTIGQTAAVMGAGYIVWGLMMGPLLDRSLLLTLAAIGMLVLTIFYLAKPASNLRE